MDEFSVGLGIMLVAILATFEWILGTSMFSRPLITASLVGLLLGDLSKGIFLGAMFEIFFLGSFTLGSSRGIDNISATILGTAFIIQTDTQLAVGITLGVFFGKCYQMIDDAITKIIFPYFNDKAIEAAKRHRTSRINQIHFISGLVVKCVPRGLFVLSMYLISIKKIMDITHLFPRYLEHGFSAASLLFLIMGIVVVIKNSVRSVDFLFCFLGFVIVSCFKISILNLVMLGVIVFLIHTYYWKNKSPVNIKGDDNDF